MRGTRSILIRSWSRSSSNVTSRYDFYHEKNQGGVRELRQVEKPTTSSELTSSSDSSRPSILIAIATASEVSGVTFRDAINASNVIRVLPIAAVTTRCKMRC